MYVRARKSTYVRTYLRGACENEASGLGVWSYLVLGTSYVLLIIPDTWYILGVRTIDISTAVQQYSSIKNSARYRWVRVGATVSKYQGIIYTCDQYILLVSLRLCIIG